MIKYILLNIILSITLTACGQNTMKKIDLTDATLKIDSCAIYYKGKKLELGQSIKEWEEVLGKPSRSTSLGEVWDDIGIAVDDWQNRDSLVSQVYIFFLNLNSPEGQAGKLTMARDWKPFCREDYLPKTEDKLLDLIKEESDPKNYIYAYKVYQGYVDLHGGPVGASMKVEEINAYRKKLDLPFSGLFRYLDQDIDGVNNSGITDKTLGGEYSTYGTECKDGRIMAYSLVYGYDETLEYLLLSRESLSNYQDRKERETEEEKNK